MQVPKILAQLEEKIIGSKYVDALDFFMENTLSLYQENNLTLAVYLIRDLLKQPDLAKNNEQVILVTKVKAHLKKGLHKWSREQFKKIEKSRKLQEEKTRKIMEELN